MKKSAIYLIKFLILSSVAYSQTDKNIHLTTGIGVNNIQGELKNTFKSTVAFNSGFEKAFGKNWYAQVEFNFNSLRYNQRQKDDVSPYLYQNTSSSLFMINGNWGYDIRLGHSPWFYSIYAGTGYLNIGKPRVVVDDASGIATQLMVRSSGILGKAGNRIGVNTNSTIFHTLYIDASWWTTSVKTEGERFSSVSVFAGIRMAMGSESNLVKKQKKAATILQ
jgi:hypothetical protein